MPRTTNADRIVKEARERMDLAQLEFSRAARALDVANAALQAHKDNVAALEVALAPKPRKKGDPKPAPAATAEKETKPTKAKKCDVCYEDKDNGVHDKSMGYADYHEFDPGKPGKKAKQKPYPEVQTEQALGVGAGD